MRLIRLVPLLIGALLLGGCSSVVAGIGSVPPSVSPSSGSSGVQPGGPTPQCAGPQPITVSGAPFCYLTPSGFFNATNSMHFTSSYPYKTAVQYDVSGIRDLITVSGRRATIDATQYRDAELIALMSDSLSVSNVVAHTPPTILTVSGHRAVQTVLRFADGVQSHRVLVFVGYARVSVSCQWQKFQAQIAAGCASVLSSLRISG